MSFHPFALVAYGLLVAAVIGVVLLLVAARSGGTTFPTPTTDNAPQLLRTASNGDWCNADGGCVDPLDRPAVVVRTLPRREVP